MFDFRKMCLIVAGFVAIVFPGDGSIFPAVADTIHSADHIPRYNAENDTYYQLISVQKYLPDAPRNGLHWDQAGALAAGMRYEGRRGRLAIVNSPQIHEFLNKNFYIDREAWIGLRYWCHYHRMTWVDGSTHKLSGFNNWASPWNIGGSDRFESSPQKCSSNTKYWAVHYWRTDYGFNWNANGQVKAYQLFFVEYPPNKTAPAEPQTDATDKPQS